MAKLNYWIKERFNVQLGTYWVPCGQMTKADARKCERPIYGSNTMHGYDTEAEYKKRLKELKDSGSRVH